MELSSGELVWHPNFTPLDILSVAHHSTNICRHILPILEVLFDYICTLWTHFVFHGPLT